MKPATFQIVHYVPNLFVGGRVPIAAIVKEESEARPRIVRAAYYPDERCLGGREHVFTLQRALERLENEPSSFASNLGPHLHFEEPRQLPSGVIADSWLRESVLPHAGKRERERGPRRSTFGYRWLSEQGVAKWVRKRFKPGRPGTPDLFGLREHNLEAISQWASDGTRLLLLEPIIPHDVNQEPVARVATVLSAYRFHTQNVPTVQLAVYMLAGSSNPAARAWTRRSLTGVAHVVFDTQVPGERDTLVESIRDIGEHAPLLH